MSDHPPAPRPPGCGTFLGFLLVMVFTGQLAFDRGGPQATAGWFGLLAVLTAAYLGAHGRRGLAVASLAAGYAFYGGVLRNNDPRAQAEREARLQARAVAKAQREALEIERRFVQVPLRTTVADMVREFRADEAAATKKYEGQTFSVRGLVEEVVTEGENPRLVLKGEGGGVFLRAPDADRLALAQVGEHVEARARFAGYMLMVPTGVLEELRLVDAPDVDEDALAALEARLLADLEAKDRDLLATLYQGHPLALATRLGRVPAMREALAAGADPGARTPGNDTPLLTALAEKNLEALDVLLEGGAPVEPSDGHVAPLQAAVQLAGGAAVRRLLEAGADPDRPDTRGQTPLHLAVIFGKAEAVDALLAGGADPKATNPDGKTPGDLAKESGEEALQARLDAAAGVTRPPPRVLGASDGKRLLEAAAARLKAERDRIEAARGQP